MSPINFDLLQSNFPEYGSAWALLREWFKKNWRKKYVELTVLARQAPEAIRLQLVLALEKMIESGMMEPAYRVRAPGGYLLEDSFAQPDDIPNQLPDRDFSGFINISEGKLVSGYRWENTADAA